MRSFTLFFARIAVTAWIGAAVLFVVVGVSEVVHKEFTSEIRDQLVVIRFPWFYRFGFALIGTALAGTVLTASGSEFSARRKILATGLLAAALLVMIAEYFTVYVRLAEMVTPPGKTRTPEFQAYHKLSMYGNLAGLLLCAGAMGLLNWPAKSQATIDIHV